MIRQIKTILVILLINCSPIIGQAQNNTLEQGFKNLPQSGKARTMWFWINGNVSKTGITADLEAMKEIGLQGALIFNVSLQHPAGAATYLSPKWLELFHFAALEAQRLGLELSFHNGAGWSSTGGPSITPQYAMQEVVYAELTVQGGKVFKGQIPQPSTKLDYYKDIAVFAFPKPKSKARISHLDYKILSGKVRNHLNPDDKIVASSAIVKKTDIINLTSKITESGLLEWEVPKGAWTILRLGHTPTGSKNRFPSDGGSGLECDKMNSDAVDVFWEGGIMPIINKLDTLIGSVLANCHVDSYEVGTTNWTANFANEFKRLRAYDCSMYLPALAGYYIESGEETERFLWDFRRTIGDLIATNYYGRFRERCHQYGMLFSTEPYWGPFDNMQVGANADAVLSEFWSGHLAFFDSPKFVASIAKLNGSAIAEAEAFTDEGGWQRDPGSLKAIADLAWTQGINRFVIHCYAHQPWNVAPGLTLDRFGIDFNRHNTWWKQGKSFLDYINRGQFLLQQGTAMADILVFTGEASPNDALLIPQIKALGYDYDLVGSNKIASLSVKDSLIINAHGATYKALLLPQNSWITPETLSKLEALAKGGAIILGVKPKKSPSLKSPKTSDKKVAQLADELWGEGLIKDISVLDFLKHGALPPDVSIAQVSGSDFDFTHRKAKDTDIYFVVNKQKESRVLNCRFRVSGMQPELWNADSGEITKAIVWNDNGDGTTSIPIQFESEGSVFVVFKPYENLSDHIVSSIINVEKTEVKSLLDLNIVKAEYGTFLPSGLVDVTQKVTSSMHNNQLEIFANRDLCSGDPAPGYHKELRVQYSIGGAILETYAKEKELLKIDAGNKGELRILKAVFGKFERGVNGIPPSNPVYDVTEDVKARVAAGILEIPVNDTFIIGKPKIKTPKILRVTYTTISGEKTIKVPYGSALKLSQDMPNPKLGYKNGKAIWKTPFSGALTYTTLQGKTRTVKVKSVPKPIELSGTWTVQFPNIEQISSNKLISWSEFTKDAIRYFSGTATYTKEFTVSKKLMKGNNSFELDLGSVKEIAEVIINGQNLGVLWKPPFRVNMDKALKPGVNTIELRVTNLWPNRLIGDEQLPLDYERKGNRIKQWPDWLINETARPTQRTTFAAYKHWGKKSELLPSGLLGPVRIVVFKTKEL